MSTLHNYSAVSLFAQYSANLFTLFHVYIQNFDKNFEPVDFSQNMSISVSLQSVKTFILPLEKDECTFVDRGTNRFTEILDTDKPTGEWIIERQGLNGEYVNLIGDCYSYNQRHKPPSGTPQLLRDSVKSHSWTDESSTGDECRSILDVGVIESVDLGMSDDT